MDSRRAEAFSDGVFAVAITVLVFDLLPIGHEALSYRVLAMGWPQYSAYVVSFMTIGIMWINHHTLFGHVRVIDRTLLVLNLLLLMGIVAIPFPTALVAEHLTGPTSSGGRPAAVVYGAVMLVISVCYNAIWVHLILHAGTLGYGDAGWLRAAIPRAGPGRRIPRWSIGLGGLPGRDADRRVLVAGRRARGLRPSRAVLPLQPLARPASPARLRAGGVARGRRRRDPPRRFGLAAAGQPKGERSKQARDERDRTGRPAGRPGAATAHAAGVSVRRGEEVRR